MQVLVCISISIKPNYEDYDNYTLDRVQMTTYVKLLINSKVLNGYSL